MANDANIPRKPLAFGTAIGILLVSAAAFLLAYTIPGFSFLISLYLTGLVVLARVATIRQAFYFGLAVGMLTFPFELTCFYNIFGPGAAVLWLVMAFWTGLFVALAHLNYRHLPPQRAMWLVPFLWTGIEYFRSELYFLKFSWMNIGFAFAHESQWLPLKVVGVYGVGFVLVLAIAILLSQPLKRRLILGIPLHLGLALLVNFPKSQPTQNGGFQIAGIQMEFPAESVIVPDLDRLIKQHPDARLIVLSEYTYDGLPPESLKNWCRSHERYVVVGGKDPIDLSHFYNTAFVIGPNGKIIFRQVKSVPIQFFKDGRPATDQKLWDSPWGKIGICICYDLSYTRVVDRLIRLGAQAIIVPTMDVVDWGRKEHELHARVAPMRAAEYGVPIFRLASSGISQCVDLTGKVTATAPFPGEEEMLLGNLSPAPQGHLPLDRVMAPLATLVTGIFIVGLAVTWLRKRAAPKPPSM